MFRLFLFFLLFLPSFLFSTDPTYATGNCSNNSCTCPSGTTSVAGDTFLSSQTVNGYHRYSCADYNFDIHTFQSDSQGFYDIYQHGKCVSVGDPNDPNLNVNNGYTKEIHTKCLGCASPEVLNPSNNLCEIPPVCREDQVRAENGFECVCPPSAPVDMNGSCVPSDDCPIGEGTCADCGCPPGTHNDLTSLILCVDPNTLIEFDGVKCVPDAPVECPPMDGNLSLSAQNISAEDCLASSQSGLYNVSFHETEGPPPLSCCYSALNPDYGPDDNDTNPDPDTDGDGIPDSEDDDDDGDGIPDGEEGDGGGDENGTQCDNGGCARLTTKDYSNGLCVQDYNSNCVPDIDEGGNPDPDPDDNVTDPDPDDNGTDPDPDDNGTDPDPDDNGTDPDDNGSLPGDDDYPSTDGNNTAFEDFGKNFGEIVDGFIVPDILPQQGGGNLEVIRVTIYGKSYVLFDPTTIPPSVWTTMQSVFKFFAIISAIITIFSSI